ncbi:transposase [Candidatus Methylobacter favarea]|uniref:Transposase n=1 Tax=Candidatus Methylobacter favarea TaxID=2707345 RepID=A0A8S0YAZ0_9GAMM|nr:transposase [Candidatus Methylobacter favarea]
MVHLRAPVQYLLNMFDNRGMRKVYPSDINREQFEQLRTLLESVRKQTKPRSVDLYEVFCGILYLLKSACQWPMLPSDVPNWRSGHYYFSKWSVQPENALSLLEQALKKSGWRGPA